MNPGRWLAEQVRTVLMAAPVESSYVEGASLPMAVETIETLEASRLPRWKLKDLESLRIAISDRSRRTSSAGRTPRRREVTVQLMIVKKLDAEHTELEDLIELVYAIDMLLAAQTQLQWLESINEPIYDPAKLDSEHVFHSVLTVTFGNTN
jgi:hypothetical protein